MIIVTWPYCVFSLDVKAMESYDHARLYLPRLDANVMQCGVDHFRVSYIQVAPSNPTPPISILRSPKCFIYFHFRHSYW
jgi:hypothetical protein